MYIDVDIKNLSSLSPLVYLELTFLNHLYIKDSLQDKLKGTFPYDFYGNSMK